MKKVFIFILIVGIIIGGFLLLKKYNGLTDSSDETTGSNTNFPEAEIPPVSTEVPNNNTGDKNNETTHPENNTAIPEESTTIPDESTTPAENDTIAAEQVTQTPEDSETSTPETTTPPDTPSENKPSGDKGEDVVYPDEDIVYDLSANVQSQDLPVGIAIFVSVDGTIPYTNGQKITGSVSADAFGNQIVTFGEFKAVYLSDNWDALDNVNVSDPFLVKTKLTALDYEGMTINVVESHYYDRHIQSKTIYSGIVYKDDSEFYMIVDNTPLKPGSSGGIFWMLQNGNSIISCQVLLNRDPDYIGDNISITFSDGQQTAFNKIEILAENITPGMVVDISEYLTENVKLCYVTTVDLIGITRTIESLSFETLNTTKTIQCCIIKDDVVCHITLILQH